MKPWKLPTFCGLLLGAAVSQTSCTAVPPRPDVALGGGKSVPASAITSPAGTQIGAGETARAQSAGSESNLAAKKPRGPAQDPLGGAGDSSAGAKRVAAANKPRKAAARVDGSAKIRLASASSQAEDVPSPAAQPGEPDQPASDAEAHPDKAALSGEVNLKDAPLENGDQPLPINLATALKLADARPLIVAAAQASAWVAEAQLQRAQVIWVPTLNFGGDYTRHDGFGPDFNRGVNTSARPLNQNVNFLYAGTGLTMGFAFTDAYFEPLAARQVLNSRRWDIQSAKNDALLNTARAYFDVHQYRGQYAGAVDVVDRGQKLLERITLLSEDLVPKVEADRAKRMLATAEQNAATARQQWRVASANLTQALRLDPRVVIDPAEHDHVQITLIDADRTLDDLIPTGLTNRPELASHQAMVNAVAERIRREKGRVLTPSILFNGFQTPNELIQVGAQGIGFDRNLNLWSVRDDFSPQVVWQLEGMGYGNLARIKEQRGEQSREIVELFKVQDAVAADVTRAQARVQSAAVRVVEAERSMREALITYEGNFEGLRQTKRFENVLIQVYRPQEAVVALNDLMLAYNQYFSTVADYNRSQFELYHALGYPAIEVSQFHTPGEVEPVDTTRPEYLPPVGEGPPPATR